MARMLGAAVVVSLTALVVGCGDKDKGADMAACRIEADAAFPAHDEIRYSDRVTKCMRVRGWQYTILGGLGRANARKDCTDPLGPSALEKECYEDASSTEKSGGN